MNEISKSQLGWQICRAFLIWLALFIGIVVAMPLISLAMHVPGKLVDMQMPRLLIFAAAGASLWFPFVGLALFIRWLNCWRNFRRALVGAAILATLITVFYAEENWRGKRAWENCKRELEAKGAVLDWNKYIPPPVPDDQNFFTYSTNILLRFHKSQTDAQSEAATKLQWLRLSPFGSNSFPIFDSAKSQPPVVANLIILPTASDGRESGTNNLVVTLNAATAPEQVRNLIQTTLGRSGNGAAGFKFSEFQFSNLAPARIVLRTDTPPSVADLTNLVLPDLATNLGRLQVAATSDKIVFQVTLTNVQVTAAADYLKWSDQFEPAFDDIREALKRPCAILPGDYSVPWNMPIPNFVMMRSMAQTLAQRAQCHLLLRQPDQALRDVILIHDVCRILEKPPTGHPETLVEAMINVAITGLYVANLQEGFRLHAWQEPQLAAIQKQLQATHLLPFVAEAMRSEQAFIVTLGEKFGFRVIFSGEVFNYDRRKNWYDRLSSHGYDLIPRGWMYQNIKYAVELGQPMLDCLDPANAVIRAKDLDKAHLQLMDSFEHPHPFQQLAAIAVPNFIKAFQTLAYNQTLANQAQVVCALERYRLANGHYPETLDALVPQLIEKLPPDIIGGQPLHYRRTADGKFLLYSVGWNETDDGGLPGTLKDVKNGDWVWQ